MKKANKRRGARKTTADSRLNNTTGTTRTRRSMSTQDDGPLGREQRSRTIDREAQDDDIVAAPPPSSQLSPQSTEAPAVPMMAPTSTNTTTTTTTTTSSTSSGQEVLRSNNDSRSCNDRNNNHNSSAEDHDDDDDDEEEGDGWSTSSSVSSEDDLFDPFKVPLPLTGTTTSQGAASEDEEEHVDQEEDPVVILTNSRRISLDRIISSSRDNDNHIHAIMMNMNSGGTSNSSEDDNDNYVSSEILAAQQQQQQHCSSSSFSQSSVSVEKEGGDPLVKSPLLAMGRFEDDDDHNDNDNDEPPSPTTTDHHHHLPAQAQDDDALLIPRMDHIDIDIDEATEHVVVTKRLSTYLEVVTAVDEEVQKWDDSSHHSNSMHPQDGGDRKSGTTTARKKSQNKRFPWPGSPTNQGYQPTNNNDETNSQTGNSTQSSEGGQASTGTSDGKKPASYHTANEDLLSLSGEDDNDDEAARDYQKGQQRSSSSKDEVRHKSKPKRKAGDASSNDKQTKDETMKKKRAKANKLALSSAHKIERKKRKQKNKKKKKRQKKDDDLHYTPPPSPAAGQKEDIQVPSLLASNSPVFSDRFAIKISNPKDDSTATSATCSKKVDATDSEEKKPEQEYDGSGGGWDETMCRESLPPDRRLLPLEGEIVFFSEDDSYQEVSPIQGQETTSRPTAAVEDGKLNHDHDSTASPLSKKENKSGDKTKAKTANRSKKKKKAEKGGGRRQDSESMKAMDETKAPESLNHTNVVVVQEGDSFRASAGKKKKAVPDSRGADAYDEEMTEEPTEAHSSKLGNTTCITQLTIADGTDATEKRNENESFVKRLGGGFDRYTSSLPYFPWILFSIVIILCSLGTAYFGAKTALQNSGIKTTLQDLTPPTPGVVPPVDPSSTQAPSSAPITPPDASITCPEGNVPVELAIQFDSEPGEIGIFLRDYTSGSLIWNFDAGSFRSMTLMLRENYFVVCLSPQLVYEMEITDTAGNGLVSTFVEQPVYGSFRLSYQNELVTNYSGDCSALDNGAPLVWQQECGSFCSCQYILNATNNNLFAGATGQCTTSCSAAEPASTP